MQHILKELQSAGFNTNTLECDGRIHRIGDSQWYVAFSNNSPNGGEVFYVVIAGDWKTSQKYKFVSDRKMSPLDNAIIAKQVKDAQKRIDEERKVVNEEAAKKAKEIWERSKPESDSRYLEKKQIDLCGARSDGWDLVIPRFDIDGKLWSLQTISDDGEKRFLPGGRAEGTFFVMGDLGETIYVCEGYSTGASIHQSINEGVVVAFSAGNLLPVCQVLKKKYPTKGIVICGDDDSSKEKNAGREFAERAAKQTLSKAIYPIFSKGSGTDFNDLYCQEGADAVAKQILSTKVELSAIIPLGFKDGTYFFTSTSNQSISALTTFSEDNLLKLMPLEYWECAYPTKNGVDWRLAKSELMAQCRERGIFQPSHIRGSGVWMDAGRVVVNMGNYLIVDGVKTEASKFKSQYFYTLSKKLDHLKEPMTQAECETLINICTGFKWEKTESGMLLAGALVASRICGALPVRPHIWITGAAQTGKTTLLQKLVAPMLGEAKLYVQGATTEAGLRQSLGPDAVPVLFDEFETNGPNSGQNISSLVELMRASWSDSTALIIKGGANGHAMAFQARFSAIVSSIRTRIITDADMGRFCLLELKPHGNDEIHWTKLSKNIAKIDFEYSERLFSRTIKMLPTIISNYKVLKTILAEKMDARFGDQYGVLLSCYMMLCSDEILNRDSAILFINSLDIFSEKEERASNADHLEALSRFNTTKARFDTRAGVEELLIEDLIERAHLNDTYSNVLQNLGVKVDAHNIYVAYMNHTELETKVWRGTRWEKCWGKSLLRIPGAEKKLVRIGSSPKLCVSIPRHKSP